MNAIFHSLESIVYFDEIVALSFQKPVLIFKHSNSCSISAAVYEDVSTVNSEIYLVVVQDARAVSNEIASRFGVRHESPQMIILRNGKVVYHASHFDINSAKIESKLPETCVD
jgi:bacillithiol system protein YtxJ